MNTSDQNVFTLDTAFQRRWDMQLISNNLKDLKEFIIEDTNITWKEFAMKVNEILATQDGVMSSEDKSLGAWFIRSDSPDKRTVSKKRFANKVLKYLWDDAFKFDRNKFFKTDYYKTLEQVIDRFMNHSTTNNLKDLLKISIGPNSNTDTSTISENSNEIAQAVFEESEELVTLKGENVIFYGVPGSGKSFSVQNRIDNIVNSSSAIGNKELEIKANISRVVFHPDYTYSDFTGQILPTTEECGQVKYVFKEGPFTSILRRAVNDKKKMPYFLIIEEINRGNASAIFGDIFQLLDRNENGVSEYSITNAEIAQYVFNNKKEQLKLPENLWIFATMNTSDQNVFTLDTAFQRRWDMQLISNNLEALEEFIIEDTNITWKEFAMKVNEILATQAGIMSSEDKRLGAWFIRPDSADERTISKKRFANKVLKYLWDDAFKFDRNRLFNIGKYKTLEQVIDYFMQPKFTNSFGDLLHIFIEPISKLSETLNTNG
ncbi:MAG: AAA family ATPase [Christensenellaceae bacterium]|jgi:5-methylcytosine-specific restriction endonuclease McrBC GTP-binding regulatory subunit McrB|nr:AAA family ATPase [Christensenellaceae bacterium]